MKKFFLLKLLNITAVILLCMSLLCSCEDKSQSNLIDLHSFPFEYTGRLVFDGTPAELTDDVLRMVYKGDSFLKEEARHEN